MNPLLVHQLRLSRSDMLRLQAIVEQAQKDALCDDNKPKYIAMRRTAQAIRDSIMAGVKKPKRGPQKFTDPQEATPFF